VPNPLTKHPPHLLGNRRSGGNDAQARAGQLFDEGDQERVVCTTQNERVYVFSQQRVQATAQKGARFWRRQLAGLDLLDQTAANLSQNPTALPKLVQHVGQKLPVYGHRRG